MKKNISLFLALLMLIVFVVACTNENETSYEDGRYNVVATTTIVGDLVKSIGGDYINVENLMGPGIDPHGYNASAGDVDLMQNADMVVYNGLHLEGKMADVFENLKASDKLVFAVADNIDESELIDFAENPGNYDPHIWFDVNLWKEAAKGVAQQLKTLDNDNAEGYDENLQNYLEELDQLDIYIRQRIEELPEENRILITAHDAFGYLANAYGLEVRGLQGISTSSEAGTSDVRELANFIVEKEIKAIFVESSVPRKSIEALQEAVVAQGFDVKIGGELYSDSLGSVGSTAETYIGTFKENIDTIVDALK